jgi:hypothetical protein
LESDEERRSAGLVGSQRPDAERPGLEGNLEGRRNLAGRFELEEVGNRSLPGSTAEGTVLEVGVSLRMVVVLMMRRHACIGRAKLQQERRSARRHEPHGDI